MAERIFSCCNGFVMSVLILIGISAPAFAFQKNLSGNLNQPSAHVITIGPDRATVDNVTDFAIGDTILLIQMQGVKVLLSPYGSVQGKYGEPGMHEFMIIKAINGGNEIVFERNTLKTYAPEGNIQIVRVPYYNTATVTGKLFCNPWNATTKKGGVLALIIGRSLKLNADIDLSGSGFIGAKDAVGDAICLTTGLDYYPESFTNAGYKGEGVANYTEFNQPLLPNYAKGIGNNWTGGGGGNGRYAGGGGGSNKGAGGDGGLEDCFPSGSPAIGGLIANHPSLTDRIFFGGGGGGSTSATGLAPAGGNGGGIVIIVADTIVGNGGKILSNGGSGYNAGANSGSGGGGGGGSIALSFRSFGTKPLEFQISGGKGGDNPGSFGEGGGGGGGLLFVSNSLPSNVTKVLSGGNPGSGGSAVAGPGDIGEVVTGFKAILNGFLFNSIRSSVTGDQVDSICSNMMPPVISGTLPIGGSGPYTYKWEKSYDQTTWILLSTDNFSVNYTPTVKETTTVYFKRTITDSSLPSNLTDFSKTVKIIVQPFIKNNIVGTSDTICFAQDPSAFAQLGSALADGNGKYAFKWQVMREDETFYKLPSNTYDASGYTPLPGLLKSSFYRRTVTSGRCVDSTAIVKITVLDTVRNNKILSLPQEICFGTTFADLTATTTSTTPALGGGDNLYRFRWEARINSTTWTTATGTSNQAVYNPPEQPEKDPFNVYYFRRIVLSGNHDVCVNISTPILLKDFPIIRNNTVSTSQTICSGSAPSLLVGSVTPTLTGGNTVYTYAWEKSTKAQPAWTPISGATGANYQPPVLTDTVSYRRIVNSLACADISGSIIINVHKPIANNTVSLISGGADTTICNGQIPHSLIGTLPTGGTNIPGSYIYQWKFSTDNVTYNTVASAGTAINYQPVSLAATTYYKREVTSGTCSGLSNAVTLKILPLITNNTITANQTICFNTPPSPLSGSTPSGGNGTYTYYWERSSDGGTTWSVIPLATLADYAPPSLTIPMKYKRTVTSGLSGCCTNVSNVVTISQYPPLPTGKITNVADTSICGGLQVLLKVELTGTSPWKVTYRGNTVDSPVMPAATAKTTLSITPASSSALDIYTYSLVKVEDNNGCLASSLTGTKKANVYKVPIANAGPDKSWCGPIADLSATPSVGTGIWKFPASVVSSTANGPNVTVTIDDVYVKGKITHNFIWEETNWTCKSQDAVDITFFRFLTTTDAGPDTILYSFDNIFRMSAFKPEAWEHGTWSLVSGGGSFENDTLFNTVVTGLGPKVTNIFKWSMENGECKMTDEINVYVDEIKIPEGFSPNGDGVNDIFEVKGLDLNNQDAELKIVNGAGSEVFSTSKIGINKDTWIPWDGKNSYGYDLPEGTYYYLLKLISIGNGQIHKKSGFIILKRY
jgi:gliding motility-associated-like protein